MFLQVLGEVAASALPAFICTLATAHPVSPKGWMAFRPVGRHQNHPATNHHQVLGNILAISPP